MILSSKLLPWVEAKLDRRPPEDKAGRLAELALRRARERQDGALEVLDAGDRVDGGLNADSECRRDSVLIRSILNSEMTRIVVRRV
jgi:hypothetical protein